METGCFEETGRTADPAAGRVHIYCGDGKGKTSAAVGLAVRAAGRGRKVLIARFLKSDDSGEVRSLAEIPGICVMPCLKTFGFFWSLSEEQKREAGEYCRGLFCGAWDRAVVEKFDMLVLDVIMAAMKHGLIREEEVRDCLSGRPAGLEVVLTGRDPSPEMVKLADYVSEIRKVKHPFDDGIRAREGIEY